MAPGSRASDVSLLLRSVKFSPPPVLDLIGLESFYKTLASLSSIMSIHMTLSLKHYLVNPICTSFCVLSSPILVLPLFHPQLHLTPFNAFQQKSTCFEGIVYAIGAGLGSTVAILFHLAS